MLKEAVIKNLLEIKLLAHNLLDDDYTVKQEVLSGCSIGQHVRHILEFYTCLFQSNKIVCYDDRKRDLRTETDRNFTNGLIYDIIVKLNKIEYDYPLKLKSNFSTEDENEIFLQTSLYREVAYCLEHSIHHQALIKMGITQLKVESILSDNFGVAPSTVRFQNQAAILRP